MFKVKITRDIVNLLLSINNQIELNILNQRIEENLNSVYLQDQFNILLEENKLLLSLFLNLSYKQEVMQCLFHVLRPVCI